MRRMGWMNEERHLDKEVVPEDPYLYGVIIWPSIALKDVLAGATNALLKIESTTTLLPWRIGIYSSLNNVEKTSPWGIPIIVKSYVTGCAITMATSLEDQRFGYQNRFPSLHSTKYGDYLYTETSEGPISRH